MFYQLRPGLMFCVVDEIVVFLDIETDRYFALSKAESASFNEYVDGRPLEAEDAARLIRQRILVQAQDGILPSPCPTNRDVQAITPSGPPASAADILLAASAVLSARLSLRYRGLAATLSRLEQTKSQIRERSAGRSVTIARIADAHRRFGILAGSLDRCLPLSIALVGALARRRVAADLVLGVMLSPFRAHAWVEHEHLILNDRSDRVRNFQPIARL